jgi:cell division inhibitor SepF
VSILNKFRDFVGLNEAGDYEYEYDEMEGGEEYQSLYQEENVEPVAAADDSRRRFRDRPVASPTLTAPSVNNVIGMPGALNGLSEVVVMEPRSFEEMPQAIQALRERKSVVLNLTMMDPDQAQRAVDFVAGGTYAIDGHQERVGESIFLFTPNCVAVVTQQGAEGAAPQAAPQQTARPAARPSTPAPAWATEQRVAAH